MSLPQVRSRAGYPVVNDFSSGEGTPIVVDSDTGNAYVLIHGAITPLGYMNVAAFVLTYGSARAGINAAVAASKRLFWPAGTYDLGNMASGDIAVDLSAAGEGLDWKTDGQVKIVCNTTSATGIPTVCFQLRGNSNSRFGDFEFQDTGFDVTIPDLGAYGFYINSLNSASSNLKFGSIRATSMEVAIGFAGASMTYRSKGTTVEQIHATDCYYCCVFQNNGDDFVCYDIVTDGCLRSYYPYGVSGHDVIIDSKNGRLASGDAIIVRRTDGGLPFNTRDIKMRYRSRGSNVNTLPGQGMILLAHVTHGVVGKIENIQIHLDIAEVVTNAIPVLLTSYVDETGTLDTPPIGNEWNSIFISGQDNSNYANTVVHEIAPVTKGHMRISAGNGISVAQSVLNNNIMGYYGTYTPAWTQATTPPTTGDAVLAGYWTLEGNVCSGKADFVWGSTSAEGTGVHRLSLPFPAAPIGQQHSIARLHDTSSGNNRLADAVIGGATSYAEFQLDNDTDFVRPAVPWAWAVNDYITFSFSYLVSSP